MYTETLFNLQQISLNVSFIVVQRFYAQKCILSKQRQSFEQREKCRIKVKGDGGVTGQQSKVKFSFWQSLKYFSSTRFAKFNPISLQNIPLMQVYPRSANLNNHKKHPRIYSQNNFLQNSSMEFEVTGLLPGSTYTIAVRAKNKFGTSMSKLWR